MLKFSSSSNKYILFIFFLYDIFRKTITRASSSGRLQVNNAPREKPAQSGRSLFLKTSKKYFHQILKSIELILNPQLRNLSLLLKC